MFRRVLFPCKFGWQTLGPDKTLVIMTTSFLASLLAGAACGYITTRLLGDVLGVVVGVFAAQTAFLVVWLLAFIDHSVLVPILVSGFYGLGLGGSILIMPTGYAVSTAALAAATVLGGILVSVWLALIVAALSLWGSSSAGH